MKLKFGQYKWVAVTSVALLATVLASCGGGSGDDDGGDNGDGGGIVVQTPAGGSGGSTPSGGGSTTEGDTVTVVMTDNVFTPNKISVKVNTKVTFVAKNEGAAVHNMKVLSAKEEGKDFASDAMVNPDKESKFTATFKKTGTYKFQCDYHVPDMVGTIEVK